MRCDKNLFILWDVHGCLWLFIWKLVLRPWQSPTIPIIVVTWNERTDWTGLEPLLALDCSKCFVRDLVHKNPGSLIFEGEFQDLLFGFPRKNRQVACLSWIDGLMTGGSQGLSLFLTKVQWQLRAHRPSTLVSPSRWRPLRTLWEGNLICPANKNSYQIIVLVFCSNLFRNFSYGVVWRSERNMRFSAKSGNSKQKQHSDMNLFT